MITERLTEHGEYVDADESANVTAVLFDTDDDQLNKLAIHSLTLTIVDDRGNVINNRLKSDILDNNGGSLGDDGTLVIELQPDDNAFMNPVGVQELHRLEIEWEWQQQNGQRRTGKQVYELFVRRLLVA